MSEVCVILNCPAWVKAQNENERLRTELAVMRDIVKSETSLLREVVAAERERCAQIAESGDYNPYPAIGAAIAAAIRKGEP